MRKAMILALLALPLALAGCMQLEMDTVLKADGSGTYAFTMTMSEEVEAAMNELSQLEGSGMESEMEDIPDFANFDKADFEKQLEGYDAKLTSFVNEVKDGKRTVKMVLAFGDFRGLQAAMASMAGGEDSVVLTKLDNGDYLLEPGDSGISFDEEEDEDLEEDVEQSMEDMQAAMANAGKAMEIMGRLMAHSSELAMTMRITLPSDVIKHNAPRLEGRTCIWEIDSSNMMSMEGMSPRITFSGKGVDID